MSAKQNGMKRVFGVKPRRDPEASVRRFTRLEGSDEDIARTQVAGAGNSGKTMAPQRWAERRNER